MIFSSKIKEEDRTALYNLADSFGWSDDQLDYLIACMMFESGLNTKAVNKLSNAVGLIQFMPTTCKSLGTTSEEMLSLTFSQQLQYVKAYFLPYHKKVKTLNDMYMAILMPKYIGKPNSENIFSSEVQYRQNKGLDDNKDGVITKQEACSKVLFQYHKGLLDV